jgi:DNA-binding LacI/PurR family transcriptional regulator
VSDFQVLSPAQQVAAHLTKELASGMWQDLMPGAPLLAEQLGVDPKTIDAALKLLEARGLLVPQGAGRRRRITMPEIVRAGRPLRVEILLSDAAARHADYMVKLQHTLLKAGHDAYFCRSHLVTPGMNLTRVQKIVNQSPADAWVVVGGSREVLEWFSGRSVPTFALFGRTAGLALAAAKPDKAPAYAAAVRHLVSLGHRRIALLARRMRRLPVPGRSERAFLRELEARGIRTSSFNLPDWEDNKDGFHKLLTTLFQVTPPTALIIQEAFLFHATQQFLSHQGLRVPHDVSLVCSDNEPGFAWFDPPVSHIHWDSQPLIRRIKGWAADVKSGRVDQRETLTKAEFVEGGTIGPVNAG